MSEHWVLIHGWGVNVDCWHKITTLLPNSDDVQCFALPGHGRCEHPIDWDHTIQRFAEKIVTQSIIVGWSLGGMLAIALAERYPTLVKKIVLITTNPCWLAKKSWPGVLVTNWVEYVTLAEANFVRAYQQFLILQGNMQKPSKQLQNHTPEKLVKMLDWLVKYDLRSALRQLKMPVLHILGEFDKLVPQQLQQSLARWVPTQKVIVINQASHNLLATHPEKLANLFIDWSQQ